MQDKRRGGLGFLLFLMDELRKYSRLVGDEAQRLLRAGEALENMVRRWRKYDWAVPRESMEDSRNLLGTHIF